ncbi:MAG: hypothetical protein WC477_02595 [Patescibacteria group bacterium]
MTPQIIPSILCDREYECLRRLALIEPAVQLVQIDVMDGTLTKQSSWHEPSAIIEHHFHLSYELHLMVTDPLPIIDAWRRVPGFTRAIIHAEIPKKVAHIITAIKKRNLEAGIAISPGTPVKKIIPLLRTVDCVLVMGGVIGKSGRALNKKSLDTVREIRKRAPKLHIGFDIGVNKKTISSIVQAGADRICSANAIFKSTSPLRAVIEMQSLAEHASIVAGS